jgi:hypothetical protein
MISMLVEVWPRMEGMQKTSKTLAMQETLVVKLVLIEDPFKVLRILAMLGEHVTPWDLDPQNRDIFRVG